MEHLLGPDQVSILNETEEGLHPMLTKQYLGNSKIVVPIPVHVTRQFAMRNQNYGGLVNANAIKGPEKMDLRPYLNIAGTGENFLSDQDYPSLFKGLQRN